MPRRPRRLVAVPAAVLAALLAGSVAGPSAALADGGSPAPTATPTPTGGEEAATSTSTESADPDVAAAEAAAEQARREAVQRAIDEISAELETLTAAEQAAADQLAEARQQLGPAEAALATAQKELDAARARDEAAQRKLLAAKAAVRATKLEIVEVASRIGTHENVVGRVARLAYQQGPLGNWDVLLETRTPDDLTQRLAMIDTVGETENEALSTLRADRSRLNFLQASLEARRTEVALQQAATRAEVARTKGLEAKAEQAAAAVDVLVQQRSEALAVATQARIEETVRLARARGESARLARRLAARQVALGAPVLPLRGSMAWPIDGGQLAGEVGPRINPFTRNLSCHSGIDISAPEGTPIRAAADGIVIATMSTEWDGLTTIIAHGQGLSTWYAHQSRFGAKVGEQVRKGEVIGYVGATGFATGPHLHFNVARGDAAYDPMGWFGGVKRQVAPLCDAPYPPPFL